jgi:phosphotransferase system enzyme I (PtsP)
LTQFLFAADRANPKLAERYDWLSAPILRFLQRVVKETDGSGVNVGVCGEMGGRRLEALALLGIGFRRLSITPAAVAPIKQLVCQARLDELSKQMQSLLTKPGCNIREELTAWAQASGIDVE